MLNNNEVFVTRCPEPGCDMGAKDTGGMTPQGAPIIDRCPMCGGRGFIDVLAITGVKSHCCEAPVISGGENTTHYYVCTKCSKPCDQSTNTSRAQRHKRYGV